jgi:outer membrane protein insertion porin family
MVWGTSVLDQIRFRIAYRYWMSGLGLFVLLSHSVVADSLFRIKDIRIEGLQRVSVGTVFNYLPAQINDQVDEQMPAAMIQALYATGFFDDVVVKRDGNLLVITVRERPSVATIDVEGNEAIATDDLKAALRDIGLAEGRIFKRAALDRVEQTLRGQYFALGRYGMTVESTVSPLERNRVAVHIRITEGLNARLKQINIIGNLAFDDKTLLGLLTLSESKWHSFYTGNDQYAKEKLVADLETLRSFYLDRGYIRFKILSTQVSISPDKQGIYITITLEEGEPFRIGDIRLAGNVDTIAYEQLFPLIHLRRGEIFSRRLVTESVERVSEFLGNEGYAFSNINPVPEIDEAQHLVTVTFFIDPGKRVYVRRINMKGNTRTRDEVLRREMRQLEGSWFSTELIKKSRERLQRLDYFESVTIETPAVPGTADLVDVNVTVTEKPSGNFLAGIGYSQSQGMLFNTSVSQNNFFGTGKRVSLAFNTSDANRLYRLAYTNPYYTVDGISRGFDLSYRTTDFDQYIGADYSTDVGMAELNFGVPLSDTSRAGFGVRYQYTKFIASTHADMMASQFIRQNGDRFNDVFLLASYTRDSRDSAMFPTQGGMQTLFGEVALPGSDLQYYRINYRSQYYWPLTKRFILSARADIGYGAAYGSTDSLPFFENFYSGGPNSVRGWAANTLGPRETTGDQDPTGGNFKLAGSLELFAPPPFSSQFAKTLRFGAFFDFGNVWWTEDPVLDSSGAAMIDNFGSIDLGDLRYSAGLSVAWLSPIGALSLSLAQPLNAQADDDEELFQFSIGQTF